MIKSEIKYVAELAPASIAVPRFNTFKIQTKKNKHNYHPNTKLQNNKSYDEREPMGGQGDRHHRRVRVARARTRASAQSSAV